MSDKELIARYRSSSFLYKYVEALTEAVDKQLITDEELKGIPRLVELRLADLRLLAKPFDMIPQLKQQGTMSLAS